MASILKVDDLRRNTAAGIITITSEGGFATQSLQQGLAKAWAKFNSSATLADSFNISSTVDVQVGQWRFAKTNSMSSTEYAVVGTAGYLIGSFNTGTNSNAVESTANHTQSKYDSPSFQDFASGGFGMHNIHGDLA